MSDEDKAISEDVIAKMLDGLEAAIDGSPELVIDRLEKMADGYRKGIKQLEREIEVLKGDVMRASEVEMKKELLLELKGQLPAIKEWIRIEKDLEKELHRRAS